MESDIWQDQAEFNRQLRPLPETFEERTALTKEFVLHLISECDELLRASGSWTMHRKDHRLENPAQVLTELTDIRKYWMSLCQLWRFSEAEMDEAYWRKSAAVRQRYTEEWIQTYRGPCVILDLDNVVCDYLTGFVHWIASTNLIHKIDAAVLLSALTHRPYVDANTLNISLLEFQAIKHRFCTTGVFRSLPLMPGAKAFMDWCAERWKIVILTSRPIDRYPTLYDDTIAWLHDNDLPFDAVWWGSNKATKLISKDMQHYVQFVVDDDTRFVQQYASQGVKTYWLTSSPEEKPPDTVRVVGSLEAIMDWENHERER